MSISIPSHKPFSLSIGDTIALVAPASWCDKVEETVEALEERGFSVKVASNVHKRLSNFAGSDEERAQGFMECWRDPDVQVVWCLRGGYGSGRILDHLDYDVIKQNPKIFIGMSDITALHVALTQSCNLTTFLGPVASFLANKNPPSTFAEKELWETLKPFEKTWSYGETLVPGCAIGKLTGGNLALLAAHVGTPWQVDARGKILVLEEVDEYAYRIDRVLNQMKQAGIFEGVAGVILGTWEKCRAGKEGDWDVDQVLQSFFENAQYPVLKGFPSGHIVDQVTLPLNCLAELDADAKEVRLLESPVTLR